MSDDDFQPICLDDFFEDDTRDPTFVYEEENPFE